MEVPCPVPLSKPWSPVGYQVVQVSEENKQPAPGGLPVKRKAPRSPLGYRVNVVADEDIPLPPRPKLEWSLTRTQPRTKPVLIWAPIIAGSFFFLLPVIAIAFAMANQHQEPPPRFVQAQQFEPAPMPPPPQVVIPEDLFNGAPANPPAKEEEVPPAAAKNQADPVPKEGCENFGTEVEFVRNPQVAAKMAREEGKLTFLLHVSGNFEDARFT
jgi:hypothetical protein